TCPTPVGITAANHADTVANFNQRSHHCVNVGNIAPTADRRTIKTFISSPFEVGWLWADKRRQRNYASSVRLSFCRGLTAFCRGLTAFRDGSRQRGGNRMRSRGMQRIHQGWSSVRPRCSECSGPDPRFVGLCIQLDLVVLADCVWRAEGSYAFDEAVPP